MWEIDFKYKDSYNCFQNIIYSIANFYNKDFRMMMLEFLGFKYNYNKNGLIGDKLGLSWVGELTRRNELLVKFHGFGFRFKQNKYNLNSQIHYDLLTSPVGLYIDSYVCDWLPFYNKQHRGHICLLLHEEDKNYIFIDEFCKDNQKKYISKDFVKKNCNKYIIFHEVSVTNLDDNDFIVEFEKIVQKYSDERMFEQYKKFDYDMVNNLDLSIEIPYDCDPIQSKLIMYLKNISEDRLNFIDAINYIEKETHISVTEIKEYLLQVFSRFKKLRAYLIKYYFLKREPDILKIQSELDSIIVEEKKILQLLQDLITVYRTNDV